MHQTGPTKIDRHIRHPRNKGRSLLFLFGTPINSLPGNSSMLKPSLDPTFDGLPLLFAGKAHDFSQVFPILPRISSVFPVFFPFYVDFPHVSPGFPKFFLVACARSTGPAGHGGARQGPNGQATIQAGEACGLVGNMF